MPDLFHVEADQFTHISSSSEFGVIFLDLIKSVLELTEPQFLRNVFPGTFINFFTFFAFRIGLLHDLFHLNFADAHRETEPVVEGEDFASFHLFDAEAHGESEPGVHLNINQLLPLKLSKTHGKTQPIFGTDLKLEFEMLPAEAAHEDEPPFFRCGPLALLRFLLFRLDVHFRHIISLPDSLDDPEPVPLSGAIDQCVNFPGLIFLGFWLLLDFLHSIF